MSENEKYSEIIFSSYKPEEVEALQEEANKAYFSLYVDFVFNALATVGDEAVARFDHTIVMAALERLLNDYDEVLGGDDDEA